MLRKQAFDMTVEYIPGAKNDADFFLSRHTVKTQNTKTTLLAKRAEQFVNFIVNASNPVRVSLEEILEETNKDEELQMVIKAIQENDWSDTPEEIITNSSGLVMNLLCLARVSYSAATGFVSRHPFQTKLWN